MLIIVFTILFGAACGYFQYRMGIRLDKKRWLLLLQPGLLTVITVCFAAWTLSIDRLKGTPARLAAVPFGAVLVCTLAGWAAAERRRRD